MTLPSTPLFSNNANATIGSAVSPTDTVINLAPTTGNQFPLPTPGVSYFVMTISDALTGLVREIVWVTARNVDQLTVIRAQENTSALAWKAGDRIGNIWTAGQAQTFFQAVANVFAAPNQINTNFMQLITSGVLAMLPTVLPRSPAGLKSGQVWLNGGSVEIVL